MASRRNLNPREAGRARYSHRGPGRMAHHQKAAYSAQHYYAALAPKVAGTKPGGKHLAIHARKLDLKPGLQIIRRDRRYMLRSVEQADRSTMENNVNRT